MIAKSTRCILTLLLIAAGACQSVTDASPRRAISDSTRADPAGNDTTAAPQIASSIGLVVSDAAPLVEGASAVAGMGPPGTAADPGTVAYVSLLPGTVPGGTSATITNRRTKGAMVVVVVDGGFDPVVVSATRNDILDVVVSRSAGLPVELVTVVRRKPPRIVRTNPPRGATDVPIGAAALVVFSEPMDATTVTDVSVSFTVNGQRVPGTVRLNQDGGVSAELVATTPLLPSTSYLLVIEGSVTNLAGDALEEGAAIPFVTETPPPPPPPPPPAVFSVYLTPQSATLGAGSQVQFLAVVQDADFNQLRDRAVQWTSHNPEVATVASTGVVTAGEQGGTALIVATVEGKSSTAIVSVTPRPTGSITVTVTTEGVDLDPDGYALKYYEWSDLYPLGLNDSVTFIAQSPGQRELWLAGVDPNCVVDSDVQSVDVANGTSVKARFKVTCGSRPAFDEPGITGVWRVEKFEFFRDSALTSRLRDFVDDPFGMRAVVILQRTLDGRIRWQFGPAVFCCVSGGVASISADTLRTLALDRFASPGECWDLCSPFDAASMGHEVPSRHVFSRSADLLVMTRLETTRLQWYASGAYWPRLTLRKVR